VGAHALSRRGAGRHSRWNITNLSVVRHSGASTSADVALGKKVSEDSLVLMR
jgi:hypothetical protein